MGFFGDKEFTRETGAYYAVKECNAGWGMMGMIPTAQHCRVQHRDQRHARR
jgi:hypothetical protein